MDDYEKSCKCSIVESLGRAARTNVMIPEN
jgi:hypothetical protein